MNAVDIYTGIFSALTFSNLIFQTDRTRDFGAQFRHKEQIV